MASIDNELVRIINSGKCFALIGSGLSCDSGLPSWKQLTTDIYERLNISMQEIQKKSIERKIQMGQYPKVIEDCEKQAPSKKEFYKIVNEIISSYAIRNSVLYSMVAKWPIPVYLTTNYDNILNDELQKNGNAFIVKGNNIDDISSLSSVSENIIFKIHGDVDDYENIVLTESQYNEFQYSPTRKYWREKIFSTINMIPLIIIGYSAKDPDFSEQLERAKMILNPSRPVYMFAADLPDHEVIMYREKYNIKIVPYKTKDGDHHELRRLMKAYDSFIRKRESIIRELSLDNKENENSSSTAASLFLYTKLRLGNDFENTYYRALQFGVLNTLLIHKSITKDKLGIGLNEDLKLKAPIDIIALEKVKSKLFGLGYITVVDDIISITALGESLLANVNRERVDLQEKFNKWCEVTINREYPGIRYFENIFKAISNGLADSFAKRGIELAKSVSLDDSIDISDAFDIIDILNRQQRTLPNDNEKNAYMLLMIEIFSTTEKIVKDYIAALSQGYFSYHALGLDSSCNEVRLNRLKERPWVIDSSVILPVIALCSSNTAYAIDLIDDMKSYGIKLYTTQKLLQETIDHAFWAIKNFKGNNIGNLVFFQALMAGPGFKKNLFLDGYTAWANQQGSQSFDQYMNSCLGDNCFDDLYNCVKAKITEIGIHVTDFQDWKGFSNSIWSSTEEWFRQIKEYRQKHDTYRNDEQCLAEAEIKALTSEYEIFFLSQSLVLDRISTNGTRTQRITWTPEAVFRLLSMFSKSEKKSDLYFQGILQSFYFQGFDVINKREILVLAIPIIKQAKMNLENELKNYESKLTAEEIIKIRKGFDDVDDLSKPFYSYQIVSQLMNSEKERADYYQKKAEGLEKEKKDLEQIMKKKINIKPNKKKNRKAKKKR